MPEEEIEREYSEVRKRRAGGISQIIKNLTTWQFIIIMSLATLFFWMLSRDSGNKEAFIIGAAIVGFFFFFSKKAEASGLISEAIAKKIAIDAVESKKEDFHIPGDADVSPTNFCRLQRKLGEPLEWHVGIKIEDKNNKIDYWRVDIHPYDGIVTGIVRVPTGFEGYEMPDIVVVYPEHYMKES